MSDIVRTAADDFCLRQAVDCDRGRLRRQLERRAAVRDGGWPGPVQRARGRARGVPAELWNVLRHVRLRVARQHGYVGAQRAALRGGGGAAPGTWADHDERAARGGASSSRIPCASSSRIPYLPPPAPPGISIPSQPMPGPARPL